MLRSLLAAVVGAAALTVHASAQDLAGVWVGGTNATGHWLFAEARFTRVTADLAGSLAVAGAQAAGLPIEQIVLQGSGVRFRVRTPLGVMSFDGHVNDDVIEGDLAGAAPGASLHLVRVPVPPAAQADAAVGTYDLGGNRRLLLTYRAFGMLTGVVFERRGNDEFVQRAFYAIPAGPDRYVTSGSLVEKIRRNETLTLERGTDGAVRAIAWSGPGAPSGPARRTDGPSQISVHFKGPAGPIVGTVFLPAGPGPHPAVVVVSGSGPTSRDANVLRAREFVRLGVAALTWDKRGVGESAGEYMTAGFDALAADADSALAFLRTRPEVDAARVGMTGHSQGGWIAPLAAARAAPAPAWLVITSGGPIAPAEQEAWRARTQARAAGATDEEAAAAEAFMRRKWEYGFTGADWDGYIAAAQHAHGAKWENVVDPVFVPDSLAWAFIRSLKDFDPMAAPSRLEMPVLVLFAEHDEEEPADRSEVAWRDAFRRSGNTDYQIVTIPGVPHALWLGTGSPRPIITAPTEVIGRWLTAHGVIGSR
jgi:pimeloyl-ACP methyl ester carboxylesterase